MSPPRAFRNEDHESYDELAVGWALHALEPEDEALFGRHLPDCARCARTVAETEEVMATLATDLPPAEPSDGLRERLRAAVEETEQVRRPDLPPHQPPDLPEDLLRELRPDTPRPTAARLRTGSVAPVRWRRAGRPGTTGWRRRLPVALGASAAAVIVALGAWNVVVSSGREQAQTAAAEESHMINSLLQPGQATIAPVSDPDGHAVATVVARHGQVQVVTWGLSENNRNASTYVVWGMREGSPVPLGTFDVVQSGMDLRTVGSDHTGLDGYSGYAISLESGRKAPSTPTHVVANGQVTS